MPDHIRDLIKPIDNREANNNKPILNQSIIDVYTDKFRSRFSDPSIDPRMVARIIQNLSEANIEELAEYVERKATINKGRAFVKLCDNVMKYKAI